MKKLKIIFAGTEHFSYEFLNMLIKTRHQIILTVCQPDRVSGRGQKIRFSPVKILSQDHNIPIVQPLNLNEKTFQNKLFKLNADIMIVVAYGKKIPKNIISMFPKGCINVHPSLLPQWRGPTPIQSSILNGDKKTGISIIKMNEKIDAGSIIHVVECDISFEDTTRSLSLKLIKIGTQALLDALQKIIENKIVPKKQNEKHVTRSKKIYRKDALLDWNISAEKLERLVRAFNPWPTCFFVMHNYTIKVWKAEVINIVQNSFSIGEIINSNKNGIQINTSNNILNIQKLQFPGKRIMDVQEILLSKKKWFKKGVIL